MPESNKPLVTALVVSRNSKEELLQCLKAFFASADVPVDAVVVDNDSSDGSPAAVTDEFPHATVLVQSKNLGYGRAANVGLERCQGRFVLLLSPHVILDPQCSGRLADLLLTRPDAGAVGPRLAMPDGRLDPDARRAFPIPSTLFYQTVGLSRLFPKSSRFGRHNMGHVPESEVHEMDAGSAACLMLRRSALDRVGFFDPRYFMFGEDLDLCYRLKLGGWKVFYLPSATAMHDVKREAPERQKQISYERHRAMWTYHFKHHSEDVSAFGNRAGGDGRRGRQSAAVSAALQPRPGARHRRRPALAQGLCDQRPEPQRIRNRQGSQPRRGHGDHGFDADDESRGARRCARAR